MSGTLLAAPLLAQTVSETKPVGTDPYARVPLGKTGVVCSRFCLGTGMSGGNRQSNHTRQGQAAFSALVHGALERGITTFDLADLYGSHTYFAKAVEGLPRKSYEIISKIWFREGGIPEKERPEADQVVERFLRELRTDHIDLLLLHCVTSASWSTELSNQMEILTRLREKGLVRALGVSCHSLPALQLAVSEPWVQSVHARINPFGMSMDDKPEKVVPVLQALHSAGKGVVGMKLVGEGRLRKKPEQRAESLRYVLGLGCVDVLNVGCENLAEVDDLASTLRSIPSGLV